MAQAKATLYYETLSERKRKTIAYWLFAVCFMIFCMVVIGGLTRLTHSGLSMTDWHPIHGIIPPMNDAEWTEEFNAYRQYPEYQQINKGMSLDAFKQIFYVEWIHRIAGRITGLVVLVPLIYFTLRGYLNRGWFIRFFIMGGLIGVQAVIGWLMVQSGMKDNPDVSQYRLATHLTVAFIIFTLFFASALKWWPSRPAGVKDPEPLTRLKKWTHIFAGLLLLQIIIGGFVAGLDAGKIYNSWPLMGDRFVPGEIWFLSPWYLNLFENAAMVQFIHRNVAYLLFAFGLIYFVKLYRHVPHPTIRKGAITFFVLLLLQVLLGIKTLILGVPVALGSIHQASALILFASVIFLMVKLKQLLNYPTKEDLLSIAQNETHFATHNARKVKNLFNTVMKWIFATFNLLMFFWISSYWFEISKMLNTDSTAEQTGLAIGSSIGTGLIFIIWATGNIIIGVSILLARTEKIEAK